MLMTYAILTLGILGLFFGLLLAVTARVFTVQSDPQVDAVREVLPGANCGACGYAGCVNFAGAVVQGKAKTNGCIPGGEETARAVAEVLGQKFEEAVQPVATVFCIGDVTRAADRYIYDGVKECAAANSIYGGFKACRYGCLGLGDCVRACIFDAIKMGKHGLPVVDSEKCTGCGLCAEACPRDIIKMLPKGEQGHLVLCSSHDRGKAVSSVCSVGCIACKACIKACPRDAIVMEDNLAVIDQEKCDDCGECVLKCKPGTIHKRSAIPTADEAFAAAGAAEEKEETA